MTFHTRRLYSRAVVGDRFGSAIVHQRLAEAGVRLHHLGPQVARDVMRRIREQRRHPAQPGRPEPELPRELRDPEVSRAKARAVGQTPPGGEAHQGGPPRV